MENTKILILGKNGQVGRALQKTFADVNHIALGRDGCDMADAACIKGVLDAYAPEVIINAAAYTAVDNAEDDATTAKAINTDAVKALANWAAAHDALLVHYSTDYVFDGSKDGAYTEDDTPAPLSVYGETKLAGEQAITASGCAHLIFRTSWVYDEDGKNFPNTILRLAGEHENLRIISDQHGAPTHAQLIADTTKQCLDGFDKTKSGIYNLTPSGETTWHGIATHVVQNSKASLKCKAENITAIGTHEYPTKATRPQNSRLSVQKIETAFGLTMPHWTVHLDGFIKSKNSK